MKDNSRILLEQENLKSFSQEQTFLEIPLGFSLPVGFRCANFHCWYSKETDGKTENPAHRVQWYVLGIYTSHATEYKHHDGDKKQQNMKLSGTDLTVTYEWVNCIKKASLQMHERLSMSDKCCQLPRCKTLKWDRK